MHAYPINPEQEQVIGQAIEAGLIRNAEEALEADVEVVSHRLEASRPAATTMDGEDWLRELHACNGRHIAAPPLTDEAVERGSICGMRGL